MLEGEVRVRVDGQERTLARGRAADAGARHRAHDVEPRRASRASDLADAPGAGHRVVLRGLLGPGRRPRVGHRRRTALELLTEFAAEFRLADPAAQPIMSRATAVVTGGAGFIGSHLTDALLAEGTEVVVLDDLSTGSGPTCRRRPSLEVVDIVDRAAVDRVMDAAAPAAVFHVAAQASVTASVADPVRDCEVNVRGTLNVLEAAHRHQAPRRLHLHRWRAVRQRRAAAHAGGARPVPLSPVRRVEVGRRGVRAAPGRAASGLPHAVCRLGNVYGARQSPHGEAGVVAIFSHRLWSGQAPTVYGHGRPTRDYVHVSDVVRRAATGQRHRRAVQRRHRRGDRRDGACSTACSAWPAPRWNRSWRRCGAGELERSCLDTAHAAAGAGLAGAGRAGRRAGSHLPRADAGVRGRGRDARRRLTPGQALAGPRSRKRLRPGPGRTARRARGCRPAASG